MQLAPASGDLGSIRARAVARPELALFLAAYLAYDTARWLFAGHAPAARAHAEWIVGLERSAHVAIEGSILHAPVARALALLWGPLVAVAVVATGNHYLFDVATGLAVIAVGFAAGRLVPALVLSEAGVA